MKKNGFTMIELITTITILAALFAIGGYALVSSLENSKDDAYNIQISELKEAAQNFIADQSNKIDALNIVGEPYTITLQTLNDHGFAELPIINPKYGKEFDPSLLLFTITKQPNSTYVIEVEDTKVY